jgi:nucleoside-diphosphate-sugar epimerase
MKRILITGGSGFIGTNLIEGYINENYEILNIDKVVPIVNDHLKYWKAIDILDLDLLAEALNTFKPEIIIHLAAVTDLDGDNLNYYSANIKGTQNLIDVLRSISSVQKVIFTSSMYVCKPGFIPKDYDTYNPHTVYGQSKVEGEKLIKESKNLNFEWCIIRPTSIWGPWFKTPYIDFFETVYKGRYFDFGKACTKTYGYVGNTVYQIQKLIETKNIHERCFYLGDLPPIQIAEWGNEISNRMNNGDLKKISFTILKIAAYFGDFLKLFKINFPLTSFRLSNMTTNNVLPLQDIYKIAENPPFQRKDGIDETLEWLKKHKRYNFK